MTKTTKTPKARKTVKIATRWYGFRQNNSGGSFYGPAVEVWVEALDYADANRRAEAFGLYFNGCYTGRDCTCCGDRWSRAYTDDVGYMVEKKAPKNADYFSGHWASKNLPAAILVPLSGKAKTLKAAKKPPNDPLLKNLARSLK